MAKFCFMFVLLLKRLKKIGHVQFAFYSLPPFMVLLVIGTLAQPWLGLYRAQTELFSSWILWAGPVPIPGGMVLLALITLSLLFKFLFYSTWRWHKSGIILAHLGVLVLLIGGFVTQLTAREGFMILQEGGQSGYVYDYTARDLFVFKNDALYKTIDFETVHQGDTLALPFSFAVLNTCSNCAMTGRTDNNSALEGMAKNMQLSQKPQEKEPERNLSGLTAEIENAIYILFEGMPNPIVFPYHNAEYKIIFGKRQTALPFTLTLKNFAAKLYPNSAKARDYYSDVDIHDGTVWPARIGMNNPLRYKGYTFFQSSFNQSDDINASVLAVVQNASYPFAYLGTVLLAIGLLLHSVLILRGRV